jgi:hypothetical protein
MIVSILRYDKRLGGLFMNRAGITFYHPQTSGIFSTISLISQCPENENVTLPLSTRGRHKLQVRIWN